MSMNNYHALHTARSATAGSCGVPITVGVRRAHHSSRQHGFTLIELLVATALAALLIVGLGGVVGQVATTRDAVQDKNDLTRQARFAMEQMVRSVSHSRLLLLPLNDKPASNWLENVREETVPPTTPTDDSSKYTAVLAVTLPAYQDLDGDGFPDADDDRDGRIDEDLPADSSFDSAPGLSMIDDGGGGSVDEGVTGDDDETLFTENEDPINGIDDDGDANIDEDPSADMNGDGCPGVCGVDDDGDGSVDEGSTADDDEDGQSDEDWYNAVVFYLNAGTLMQRTPVPWDISGGSTVSGLDYITEPVAANVSRFRVERVAGLADGPQLVDITLELTSPVSGEVVSLQTQVRVGGAL
jgi:prepilin-type N-terminal cleavage/methylation domain-containing protein